MSSSILNIGFYLTSTRVALNVSHKLLSNKSHLNDVPKWDLDELTSGLEANQL